MNCTTNNLLEATVVISQMTGKQVTAIQFEDGSGYKLNYQLEGGKWQFIDLSLHRTDNIYYHQIDLLCAIKDFRILETTYNNLFNKTK